jgi:hypothetical protein
MPVRMTREVKQAKHIAKRKAKLIEFRIGRLISERVAQLRTEFKTALMAKINTLNDVGLQASDEDVSDKNQFWIEFDGIELQINVQSNKFMKRAKKQLISEKLISDDNEDDDDDETT